MSAQMMPGSPVAEAVFAELLGRAGVRDEVRREAAVALASADMKPPAAVLLGAAVARMRTRTTASASRARTGICRTGERVIGRSAAIWRFPTRRGPY